MDFNGLTCTFILYINMKTKISGLDTKGEPRPVKIPRNSFGPVKKDLNWSYRPSKHLETFLLKGFPPRMSPNVFDINEDKIYKDKCCGEFYAMFFLVMLKKKCRTSKHFAGPADARRYWSYRPVSF